MRSILFDWSGVVRDTVTNQMWIVSHIFKKYGVKEISTEEFRENWKQPPVLFYQKYLPGGYSEDERTALFRTLQLDKDCPKPAPFSDVVRLIHQCKERGYFLAVVSSDFPETLFPEIAEYGLEHVFNEIIAGANDKLEPVQKIIEENNLDRKETFFIGDSNHEIHVAHGLEIKSVAVTWGFTSERELRKGNPDYIAHNTEELKNIIFT